MTADKPNSIFHENQLFNPQLFSYPANKQTDKWEYPHQKWLRYHHNMQ